MPSLSNLHNDLTKFTNFDKDMNDSMEKYMRRLINARDKNWNSYKTFWPPRLIKAINDNNLICFFGAGLSMACGLPNWDSLLRDSLGISNDVLDDDNAKNDPLTQAELASHKIGADKVQTLIRKAVKQTNKPTYNHFLLAAFKLKYYITSNYDVLFEEAWHRVCDNNLVVILNDSDLFTHFESGDINKPKDVDAHYLFKIHGCADNRKEQMILTRSDYRRHYRSNELFFKIITEYLFYEYHSLFLGFSHKDPEITRLVEDSIRRSTFCYQAGEFAIRNPYVRRCSL